MNDSARRDPDFVIDGTDIFCDPEDNGVVRIRYGQQFVGKIALSDAGNYRVELREGSRLMRPSKWAVSSDAASGMPAEFGSRELAIRALIQNSRE